MMPLSINYLGYKVFLSGKERGGTDIYFFYLLHGRWKHEIYEQSLVKHILRQVNCAYVIDVGASYGMYSLLAASIPNVEYIFSIEASTYICRFLEKTISGNHLEHRIRLFNVAASAESGIMFNVIEMANSEWNKVSAATSVDADSIPSLALDELVLQAPKTSLIFIKMDIEGHEPDAFQGMRHLLNKRRNFVLMFEFHVGLMQDLAQTFADTLFAVPASRLYLADANKQTLLELNPLLMRKLIEKARQAKHPFNLYNLLLIDESLVGLLPDVKSAN
jgi:FkbM family methyltransferase